MKNKKTLYIVLSIVAVCLIGVAVSLLFNWPVDTSNSEGNVGKSSRFSRKTAVEGLSNMQELMLSDNNFKDAVLVSYVVMSTRANEFNSMVDLSQEAAEDIPEFKDVLKDMAKVKKMAENVCVSLEAAGNDLNAALNGEEPESLAQNTNNAALAYSTMQKQNVLANRFVDTTDSYLASHGGENRLKFVRDQWVDYLMLAAVIDGDKDATAKLDEKGYLLSAEESAAALAAANEQYHIFVIAHAAIEEAIMRSSGLDFHTTPIFLAPMLDYAILKQSTLPIDGSGQITMQGLAEIAAAGLPVSEGLAGWFPFEMFVTNALSDVITVEWTPIQMSNFLSGSIRALGEGDAVALKRFIIF